MELAHSRVMQSKATAWLIKKIRTVYPKIDSMCNKSDQRTCRDIGRIFFKSDKIATRLVLNVEVCDRSV